MNFLFGRKPTTLHAFAVTTENGRELANQEMKKPKYNEYHGPEPVIWVGVRVEPEGEPPFEARMKAGLTRTYLLKEGVRVRVQYDPARKKEVILDDNTQDILERNPQLTRQA